MRLSEKPLTGREASVLAMLAQSRYLSKRETTAILATLQGAALRIARVLVGQASRPSAKDREAAQGFVDWARQLKPRTPNRCMCKG